MVAVEQRRIAEIEPEPRAFDQHLGQRGDVAEAEIEALPGDRVDAVRGVTDQGEAAVGDPRGVVKTERVRRARRGHRDLAEKSAHRGLGFGGEIGVAQGQQPRRVVLADRPYDRRAVRARVIGHRQQRERPGGIENLVSDIVMGVRVVKRRDDRGVVIFPLGKADPGGLARWRIASLGGDQ